MGRSVSNRSESPIKGRGSPRRKSPYRRERSPARHRNGTPARDDPYRRERSPGRHRNGSPAREKQRGHAESPKHERSRSPIPTSLSPRTKRLRRAQAEREAEKEERERSHGRGSERSLQREGRSEKEDGYERKERRSARDEHDGKSSRSRHGHSTSPLDTHRKSRHRSHSPQPEKLNEKDHERNHGKGRDRGIQRERGSDREKDGVRTERRSGRDDADQRSSRSKHRQSTSPSDRHPRNRYRSQSPEGAAVTRDRDEGPTSGGSEERNDEDDSIARMNAAEEALETKKKQQPSFELSGKLADETNRVRGVTLLFNEPPDARKPTVRWRLYVFKAGEVLNEPLYIHRQSCYLFGRERRVADIPTDHPSCSKQHAVIQYRQVEKENPDGTMSKQIKPYIMDLGSTNKTFINEEAIEPQRYYELHEKDTIKFGNSSREYVLLHENSNQD